MASEPMDQTLHSSGQWVRIIRNPGGFTLARGRDGQKAHDVQGFAASLMPSWADALRMARVSMADRQGER